MTCNVSLSPSLAALRTVVLCLRCQGTNEQCRPNRSSGQPTATKAAHSGVLILELDTFRGEVDGTTAICTCTVKVLVHSFNLSRSRGDSTSFFLVLLLCESFAFRHHQILVCAICVVVRNVFIRSKARINLLIGRYAGERDLLLFELFDILLCCWKLLDGVVVCFGGWDDELFRWLIFRSTLRS